jgi:hypothetical protein
MCVRKCVRECVRLYVCLSVCVYALPHILKLTRLCPRARKYRRAGKNKFVKYS